MTAAELQNLLHNINEQEKSPPILYHVTTIDSAKKIIQEIASFFRRREDNVVEIPDHLYKIPKPLKPILKSLSIAFVGCVGTILMHDLTTTNFATYDWQFLNSKIGGLFLDPFTLLFYSDHAKIIHPINTANFHIRERIERTAQTAVKKLVERVSESQPGYEGFAMLSYIEDKTGKQAKDIANVIYEKSRRIQTPATFSLLQY